jgi:hypothetical protein
VLSCTFLAIYNAKWLHIPQDHILVTHRRQNRRSHKRRNVVSTDASLAVCILRIRAYVKQRPSETCRVVPSRSRFQAVNSIRLTYACCCMYSLELLMMDGETVRNMYSVMQK